MSSRLSSLDTVLPIQFVKGLVRAAAMSGVSENIVLSELSGLPVSKIVLIVKFFIEKSPVTTVFPMLQVINDDALTEMLTIFATAETLEAATEHLMESGPFPVLGMSLSYQRGMKHDFYRVESNQLEGASGDFLVAICLGAFVRLMPSQFKDLPMQRSSVIQKVELELSLEGNIAEYEGFFGCPVLFDQAQTRIQLSKGAIDTEITSHSPNLLAAAIETLKQKTHTLLSLQGTCFQVSQTIRALVIEKKASIKSIRSDGELIDLSVGNVSSILGLNVRSLQRKLKLEGSAFTALKNQTLVEESKRWMDEGQSNLDIISETLGFSDRASFSKVYKKYEGVWPAKYKPNG